MQPLYGRQWTIQARQGLEGLKMDEAAPVKPPQGSECLVRFEAASLNFRDLAMASDKYPGALKEKFVPCSDGAGTVVQVGPSVTSLKIGDRVTTSFFQGYQNGRLTPDARKTSLGHPLDGVLREYAAFDESGLVKLPAYLSTVEGSSFPCAAVTAWNALFGIESRRLERGQTLLTQGTGGVSLFAIQFALAVGATVIATTSSADKEERLKSLGVHHVINYRTDPNWGETAKTLSPDGLGAHHVVEVAGDSGLPQSLKAVRVEGIISVVGFLGDKMQPKVGTADIMSACCIIRGTHVGSSDQLKQLLEFCEQHKIHPIISDQRFALDDALSAYQCLKNQQFWGKIIINIHDPSKD